jgi:hypothetical protein
MRSLALVAAWLIPAASHAQVNVTTFHNDVARTGQNTLEVGLTTANVNSTQFGKLFTTTVDGYVYAQPLYVSNVSIAAGTHNVIYVATEHDSVYAIDADNGTIYWQHNLIPAGGRTVIGNSDIGTGCDDIIPEIGISGTPVIDLSSGTLYVVTKAYVGGKGVQYLHALDIVTSAEKFGGPTLIQASVAGTAYDGKNSVVSFNALQENQRPALLLDNGHVIIGWGSHCDLNPWHGWLMSYNARTLAQEAVFNASPNGTQGGIWMSGGGAAADASGNIYFSTGNGDWNGTTDFGDSIVKLGLPSGGSFPLLDYFTPYNQANMYANDDDVSSSGPLLLPTLPSNQQLLTLMGKVGTVYLVDRNHMGNYCVNQTPACINSDPQIVEEIPGATTGVWGSPAYWNGNVYWGAQNDALTAFSFNTTTGSLSTAPSSKTAEVFSYPAPTPSISSNGTSNGILWVINSNSYGATCGGNSNCQILYAYDATNLANLLYTSNQAPNNRDVPGGEIKFATPTIANSKVYVGSQYAVSAFGELNTGTTTAYSPSFTPVAGTYSSAQSITLSDSITGASIYYTLDGSTPTTGSTLYTGPFTVSSTTTVNAIATATGYANSPVSSATYTISIPLPPAATPGFVPPASPYSGPQSVTLTDSTPGAAIYYTLNGSTPTTSSTLYTGAFTVSSTTTVNAIAVAKGYSQSAMGTATYTISTPGTGPISVGITADKLYAIGTAGTPVTGGGIDGNGDAYAGNLLGTSLTYNGATYTLPSAGTNTGASNTKITLPTGSYATLSLLGAGVNGHHLNQTFKVTYTDGTSTSFSQSMSDWASVPQGYVGESVALTMPYYVLSSGATQTGNRNLYAYSFALDTTRTVQSLTLPITTNVVILAIDLSGATTAPVAVGPAFFPVAGNYLSAQSVTLSDSTPGATIYYTLDGSTPTTASTLYTGAFTVNTTTTVNAIAVATGYTTSPVSSAVYIINNIPVPTAATPAFTPIAGTYTSAQSVTLTDSTPGAAIYYTLNGSTPTTGSTLYTGAFTVSATTTVNAIAVANGYTNSAVASATYTITAATAPISVGLTTADNVYAIGTAGTPVTGGGIDGGGNAYSSSLLGTSLTYGGVTYTLSGAGAKSGATTETITLPAGSYSTLSFLGTAVGGNQLNQVFTVTYTDGTISTFTQSLSDWALGPQGYPGESVALTMPSYLASNGSTQTGTRYVYAYSFALNSAKTVQSLTLALDTDVVILGIDLSGSATTPVAVSPAFTPIAGMYTSAQSVTLTDSTPGAAIYYTLNGSTPTTGSTLYTGAFTVSATTTVNAIAVAAGYTNSPVASATYTINIPVPTAATPAFTPIAGSYTSAQSVTLTDSTPGAAIYYTLNGSTPTTGSTLYTGAFTLSATTTVNAIAVAAGYTNSPVASATYTISSGSAPISVGLTTADNVYAIGTAGTPVTGGGIDGGGNAYLSSLLGTSLTYNGVTYTLSGAGAKSAATTTTITLPAGNYTTLSLLGTAVGGNQLNQVFTVTYTDGTITNFTQSLSDWALGPQGYAGESVALTMPSYLASNGTSQAGTRYLYAYSFPLNSTKTVQSLTLALDTDVVVLAIDLSGSTTTPVQTAATPAFTPIPGSYTSAQSVTLTDSTPGAAIYYTLDGSTPTTASTLYTGAFTVSATTTVNAIAVATGYTNSPVASATYTINIAGGTPIGVSLTAADKLYAIGTPGTAVPSGGIDGGGDAYAGNLLGTSLTYNGVTYTFGAAGAKSAATAGTITLPAGSYTTLSLLATGVNGNHLNQTFKVTYTDGTTSSFTQSLSDWALAQGYAGESVALTMPSYVKSSGATGTGTRNLYAYSFTLNSAKTVKSLTLPLTTNVVVLAIDLSGSATTPVAVSPAFTPIPGTYTSAQSVTLTDSTPGAAIYYTLDGSTPTTGSTLYTGAFTVSATTTVNAIAVATGYTNSQVASATYTINIPLPTAATPAFTPLAGPYTSAQSVTLSDSTPGAAIYYTLNGSTPTTGSTLYTGAFTVSATTTVNAIAVATGYTNSPVASATYTISAGTAPISVGLTTADNVYAIGTAGTPVTGGGIDGGGNAYSSSLLGTSLTYNGVTYTLSGAGAKSAATTTTITLPAGNYTTLSFLGTAVGGNQLNQVFTVTYTDGTVSTFTQSLSDWSLGPQGYTGESVALTMPSYLASNGSTQTGTRYVYAYSFPLNSTKTVQSLTLPPDTDVVILAIDLSGSTTPPVQTAATPAFTPVAGSYTSAQSVTLSDSTPGAAIYYTLNGSTPTTASTLYTGAFTVSATTTVNAIAVATGYTASPVASATYTINIAGGTPIGVSLTASDNLYGIGKSGTAVTGGGLDGHNYAYASNLLGTSVTFGGTTYTLPAAGANTAVSNKTITLPAGSYTSLNFLGTGLNGNQLSQPFVVTYTDGTTTTFTQSLSDWGAPKNYPGESIAVTMAYRITPAGGTNAGPWYLYAYSFVLNNAKTVKSLTLPTNGNVAVLAVDLTPAAAASNPTFSEPTATYSSTQTVTLADSTPGAVIYYTLDGSTPTTASAKYTTGLTVATTTTIKALAVATGYSNSAVVSATYTISGTVYVGLSGVANVYAIGTPGTAVTSAGVDGHGYAYPGNLIGTSVTAAGIPYSLSAAGPASGLSAKTIPLTAGSYTKLSFLGAGFNGNQTTQPFVVTYTDGTTTTFYQSLSNWGGPAQGYAGEAVAVSAAYRITPTGSTQTGPWYLFDYAFTLNSAKTVKSLALPINTNVVVLAVDLTH